MSYIVGIAPTEVRTSAEGPAFKVGTIGQDSSGKVYKYVKYLNDAGAVAAAAGNICYYTKDDVANEGYANSVVTSDLSESYNLGAGVLQAVIPDAGFGWIQIRGYAVITPALTAGADGNALTAVGATDGTLDVSAAVTDAIVAFAADASAKKIICMFPE